MRLSGGGVAVGHALRAIVVGPADVGGELNAHSQFCRHRIVEADHLVLAPGAYEYVPPFPGWTLPGVMTPGAAQQLVKSQGVAPGRRVLLAGTGKDQGTTE